VSREPTLDTKFCGHLLLMRTMPFPLLLVRPFLRTNVLFELPPQIWSWYGPNWLCRHCDSIVRPRFEAPRALIREREREIDRFNVCIHVIYIYTTAGAVTVQVQFGAGSDLNRWPSQANSNCVYMYTYIYIHVYICIYVYIYIHVYTYI
jgi:hypothetical protein